MDLIKTSLAALMSANVALFINVSVRDKGHGTVMSILSGGLGVSCIVGMNIGNRHLGAQLLQIVYVYLLLCNVVQLALGVIYLRNKAKS